MLHVRGRVPRDHGSQKARARPGHSRSAWLEKDMALAVLLLIPRVPTAFQDQHSVLETTRVRAFHSHLRRAIPGKASLQAARQRTTRARPVQVAHSMRLWMQTRVSCGQLQPVRPGKAMRPVRHLGTLPARRAVQARTLRRMIRLRARLIRPRRVPRGHR